MNIISTFFIALGLSADATAVSMASSLCHKGFNRKLAFELAFAFGFFQFLMPIIGWAIGSSFGFLIQRFDHWVAFLLLTAVGGKMIYESFQKEEDPIKHLSARTLLVLAIATSIDALAIGLSYSLLEQPIFLPAFIIGSVTFLMSFFGAMLGSKLGSLWEHRIMVIGGLILFGIGLKILIVHLL